MIEQLASAPAAAAFGEHTDVFRAVAALPRRQREAVALHYFADLSIAGVARVTSSTEGAVKVLLHRARRSLAGTLQEPESEEVDGLAERG
jgi:RNA polymerase sigma-70 factor, ECF subfamily